MKQLLCFHPLGCVKSIFVLRWMYSCMLWMPGSHLGSWRALPKKAGGLVRSLTFLFQLIYADMPSGCELLGRMPLVIQQSQSPSLSMSTSKRKILCHVCCKRSSASQHAHVHRAVSSCLERGKLRRSLDLRVGVHAMCSNCRNCRQHWWVMSFFSKNRCTFMNVGFNIKFVLESVKSPINCGYVKSHCYHIYSKYEHKVGNYITFYDRCIISSFSSNEQMWSFSCFSYPAFHPISLNTISETKFFAFSSHLQKIQSNCLIKVLKNKFEIFKTLQRAKAWNEASCLCLG